MEKEEYLRDPCGTLSLPYWKAKSTVVPDKIKIIHARDWTGQYSDYQRFFRVRHSLSNLIKTDFDYDTISLDYQAKQLAQMINASYGHEDISVSEHDIMQWKNHETFREELCIYINADGGKMVASGIAEYDEVCREGIIEWVQVLPEYRNKGLGQKIVTVLLSRLKDLGAKFVTVSGNLDNQAKPLELYKKCGFEGDDVWYICQVDSNEQHEKVVSVTQRSARDMITLWGYDSYDDASPTARFFYDNIESGNAIFWSLYDEGNIAGELYSFLKLEDKDFADGVDTAYLCAFRVSEDHRGKGYGSMLMKTALSDLKSKNFSFATIGVGMDEENNQKMYEHMGFSRKIKECFFDPCARDKDMKPAVDEGFILLSKEL